MRLAEGIVIEKEKTFGVLADTCNQLLCTAIDTVRTYASIIIKRAVNTLVELSQLNESFPS